MYFGHKHVETGLNCLHKVGTFLKYHMPLRIKLKLNFMVNKLSVKHYLNIFEVLIEFMQL